MFHRKHNRLQFSSGTELVTKQSSKAECDIHNILRQFSKTGVITHVQNARPSYGDLPDAIDYQFSMNTLLVADQAFAGLPASVRDHFNNDPGRFLAAFEDPTQTDYLREVGLLNTAPPAPSDPVRPPTTTADDKTG
jgi:phage internal scaffolding protein